MSGQHVVLKVSRLHWQELVHNVFGDLRDMDPCLQSPKGYFGKRLIILDSYFLLIHLFRVLSLEGTDKPALIHSHMSLEVLRHDL